MDERFECELCLETYNQFERYIACFYFNGWFLRNHSQKDFSLMSVKLD